MSRIITAVVALVSAVVIAILGYFIVKNDCKALENELLEICRVARNKDTEAAIKKSKDLVVLWEEKHDMIESFVRHEETDTLEELIKSLSVYARQGNLERLEQQADLAIDELNHLIRGEKPLWSNVLIIGQIRFF